MTSTTLPTRTSSADRVSIDPRLNGPRRRANGGFACGTFAALVSGPAAVTLHRPVPVGRDLRITRASDGSASVHLASGLRGNRLLATVTTTDPVAEEPPVRPTYSDAWEARRRHAWVGIRHSLSDCVVCGPERSDGLRVTPGPLHADSSVLAAPYLPRADLGASHEVAAVNAPQVWGALDCVSFPAALMATGRIALLASLSVSQVRDVRLDQRYVALGWTRAHGSRSHQTSSALLDEDGELVASARAVWVELKRQRLVRLVGRFL